MAAYSHFALPKGPYTSQVHHQFLRSIPQIAHQQETIPVILTIQTLYYRGQFPPMWAADGHLALPNGPCPHQVRHQLTKSIPQNCLPERKTILVILTIQRSSSLPGWLLKATWPCPKALNSSQVRHPFPRSIPQNCSPERDNSCDLDHTEVKCPPRLAALTHPRSTT